MAELSAISWFLGVSLEKAAEESETLNETTKDLILDAYTDYICACAGVRR